MLKFPPVGVTEMLQAAAPTKENGSYVCTVSQNKVPREGRNARLTMLRR
jgi:hypothetical protein